MKYIHKLLTVNLRDQFFVAISNKLLNEYLKTFFNFMLHIQLFLADSVRIKPFKMNALIMW